MFEAECGANERKRESAFIGFIDATAYGQVPTIAPGPTGEGRKEYDFLVTFKIRDLSLDGETDADERHEQNSKSETRNPEQIRNSNCATRPSPIFEFRNSDLLRHSGFGFRVFSLGLRPHPDLTRFTTSSQIAFAAFGLPS